MRILFMGTPDFAAASLARLYKDGHEVCGVFTQPDRPKNRGMKETASPVKQLADAHGTPVWQPVRLRDGAAAAEIRALAPELIVVVAYGRILPLEILNIPPYGCINIHGSLLPKYRGAAPIQWAVLNGETVTGVTAMYLAEEMDAGDVIASKETEIGPEETSGQLFDRLRDLGAELLSETVTAIAAGTAARTPQAHEQATFAPPLSRELSPIDWSKSAAQIRNQIRGLDPWPCATADLAGTVFKIFRAESRTERSGSEPGTILSAGKDGITVACGDGALCITELQAPGGKRMRAADYLRGHPICL